MKTIPSLSVSKPLSSLEDKIDAPAPILKVTCDNFDPARIVFSDINTKTIQGTTATYHSITINYDYGAHGVPYINPFYLEGSEIFSRYGIQEKTFVDEKDPKRQTTNFTLGTSFNEAIPEQAKFCQVLNQVFERACESVDLSKSSKLKNKHKVNTYAKPIVYYPKDQNLDVIPGRPGSTYFKLISRGTGTYREQTLFADPQGKAISWGKLTKVSMKLIPLINFKSIYINGQTVSVLYDVLSAVVTEAKEPINISMQMDTISSLQCMDPSLADRFRSQMNAIESSRAPPSPAPVAGLVNDQLFSESTSTVDGLAGETEGSDDYLSNLSASAPPRAGR